jgi:2-polyprenyl-3-methyl-5-hydroxy-6-metoxy-1,4-benzoquinol methylase
MTQQTEGRKTEREYWDGAWQRPIRNRLPSRLTGMSSLMQLLREEVRPGARLLEIGCAPGKLLAWAAAALGAEVAGLDYSTRGIEMARGLFGALGLRADLRCEDAFETSFEPGSFDVVCSFGLIEHFDDPREIVRRHVLLTRHGGVALIAIPNYGGIYARLQRHLDPANLGIHNLSIMSGSALAKLAPPELSHATSARARGRFDPFLLSFDRRLPGFAATGLTLALRMIGLCQPLEIGPLCPLLVLRITRNEAPGNAGSDAG